MTPVVPGAGRTADTPRGVLGPLAGRRVLIPRGGAAGERWSAAVREYGGDPVAVPLIAAVPPGDPAPLSAAVALWNRGGYDWLAVTSPRGVAAIVEAGAIPRFDRRVAAVGPATAEALLDAGFRVDLLPLREYSAEGLAAALLHRLQRVQWQDRTAPHGVTVLLPLSELAGDTLERALAEAGHRVERVDAYTVAPAGTGSVHDDGLGVPGALDAILVTSGSVAREVARRFAAALAQPDTRPIIVALGEPTAAVLETLGLPADAVAEEHTLGGMLRALEALPADRLPDPTQSRENPA